MIARRILSVRAISWNVKLPTKFISLPARNLVSANISADRKETNLHNRPYSSPCLLGISIFQLSRSQFPNDPRKHPSSYPQQTINPSHLSSSQSVPASPVQEIGLQTPSLRSHSPYPTLSNSCPTILYHSS